MLDDDPKRTPGVHGIESFETYRSANLQKWYAGRGPQ